MIGKKNGEFTDDLKLGRMQSFTTLDGTEYYYTDRFIFNSRTGEIWKNPKSNQGDIPTVFGKLVTIDRRFIKR